METRREAEAIYLLIIKMLERVYSTANFVGKRKKKDDCTCRTDIVECK
jgi:hypothetical protein